ncbi:MAG: hypothetical protein QME59_07570, partial [Candidatus Hydrothermarchaeota archaeon]|nr:hypothetical protein [Candidatus Hydrothermarchaeota archaeon]
LHNFTLNLHLSNIDGKTKRQIKKKKEGGEFMSGIKARYSKLCKNFELKFDGVQRSCWNCNNHGSVEVCEFTEMERSS